MTNKEGHYKLWDELARTGEKDKASVFDKLFPDPTNFAWVYSCYACEESGGVCQNCPIEWVSDKQGECCRKGSIYEKWMHSESSDERKRLAAIIRDLPWKEKDHD